jgi:hypothetical protein
MSAPEPPSRDPQQAELAQLRERLARLEAPASSGSSRLLRYLPVLAIGNLLFAAPAMLISVAIAYFAFEQAEATKKMQISSVWPNVAYDFSNIGEDGERQVSMLVTNRGVGPARIAAMEVSYRGKAYADIRSLMRTCCVDEGGSIGVIVQNVSGEVIAPGDEIDFVRLTPELSGEQTYARFDKVRSDLRVRLCYCSVFDECWIEDSRAISVRPVTICPTNWTQFGIPDNRSSSAAGS